MGGLVESGVEKESVVSVCFPFVMRRDEMDRLLGVFVSDLGHTSDMQIFWYSECTSEGELF